LDGLELADGDSFDLKKSIDVLVGSDYYWSIVTGDTVVGEGGTGQQTRMASFWSLE